MGIKDFYKTIKTLFSEAFSTISEETYDNLYIDLNCLLHKCCYNCENMTHLLRKIKFAITEICKQVQPTKSINLFCDGTSPFAKLVLQRERRMNITDDITLNFTPGTIFLKNLPTELEDLIKILRIHLNVDVFIDTILPGEAEIKIKNKILENYNKNTQETHALITTDADIILILMSHKSYDKTYIVEHDKVLSLNKLLELHNKYYNIQNKKNNNCDYSFLNLLLGNDYLPKINLLTYDILWKAYAQNYEIYEKYNNLIYQNENIYKLNTNFFIDILNDIIPKMKIGLLKKKYQTYNNKIMTNYIDGLIWNFDMYVYGKCIDYHYIVSERNMISILNLIIKLMEYKDNIVMHRKIINNPINSELCGILLIPYEHKYLIDNKYNDFLEKNKYIYDKKYDINNKNLFSLMKLFQKII